MNPMNFHRFRGNWTALSAALGVGVFVALGAATLAHPTMEVGAPSDSLTADATITLTPSAMPSSVAPKVKTSPCDFKSPHTLVYGCS
jgi:hypothetical protein